MYGINPQDKSIDGEYALSYRLHGFSVAPSIDKTNVTEYFTRLCSDLALEHNHQSMIRLRTLLKAMKHTVDAPTGKTKKIADILAKSGATITKHVVPMPHLKLTEEEAKFLADDISVTVDTHVPKQVITALENVGPFMVSQDFLAGMTTGAPISLKIEDEGLLYQDQLEHVWSPDFDEGD